MTSEVMRLYFCCQYVVWTFKYDVGRKEVCGGNLCQPFQFSNIYSDTTFDKQVENVPFLLYELLFKSPGGMREIGIKKNMCLRGVSTTAKKWENRFLTCWRIPVFLGFIPS